MSPIGDPSHTLVLFQHATGLGGAELSLLELLAHARRQGIRVRVIAGEAGVLHQRFSSASDGALLLPFPYPTKPASWLRLPKFLRGVRRFLEADSGSVTFLSGDFLSLWATLLFQNSHRQVTSLWQGEYDFNTDDCVRKWLRYGAARADHLLASEPIARHANATRLLPREVKVLNPFVDDRRFDPAGYDRAALREQFGWPTDAHVTLCVGRIGVGKGQLWLAEQFVRHAGFPPKARLVLAGPADVADRGVLDALVSESAGRLIVLGPRADVPELLAAADLAIQPGRLQESFGLAAVEAALMHRPLLAYRICALPFTLGPDYPGLVDPAEHDALIIRWRRLATGQEPNWTDEVLRQRLVDRFGHAAWERQVSAALALPV